MPDAASDLYALPLEEFVAGRDALAKELRAAGDRDAAAAVKALRKPTPAAWAVNQLAREGRLEEVLEAAAGLRAAQEAALGGDASSLRDATSDERSAVDRALAQARALRPGGRPLSGATAEKVRDLLHAVARDEQVAEAVRAGRVTAEPGEVGAWGLGALLEGGGAAARPRGEKRSQRAATRSKPRQAAAAKSSARDPEAAERRKAEQARRRELRDAQEERTRLRRSAERAARRLADASETVERARAALESAEDAADEAQAAFDQARGAAAEAEARVSDLET